MSRNFTLQTIILSLCFVLTGHFTLGAEEDPLDVPEVLVDLPESCQDACRVFQGVPSIAVTSNDQVWVAWFSGGIGETGENYVLVATSGDAGKTWSPPLFIVNPAGAVRAFDPALWFSAEGHLHLFWAQGLEVEGFATKIWDGRCGVWTMTSNNPECGKDADWSTPKRLCDGIMINKPTVLDSGQILYPVSIWRFPSKFKLPEEILGANVFESHDGGETLNWLGVAKVPIKHSVFDEHRLIERRDGSLWLLCRTTYGIGESVSHDGGKTWTEVKPAQGLKHTSSRFYIRRLQSGNLLLVKNGKYDEDVGRCQLTAFISRDDGTSWEGGLLLDQRDKAAYPDGDQAPDGTIYISYDFDRYGQKEIYIAKFTEEDVLAGRLVSDMGQLQIIVNRATGTR